MGGVTQKFGPDRFSRFDAYWIQKNKQTDRQAKFINRFNFQNTEIVKIIRNKKKLNNFSD